jgi:hypothetical protein
MFGKFTQWIERFKADRDEAATVLRGEATHFHGSDHGLTHEHFDGVEHAHDHSHGDHEHHHEHD